MTTGKTLTLIGLLAAALALGAVPASAVTLPEVAA